MKKTISTVMVAAVTLFFLDSCAPADASQPINLDEIRTEIQKMEDAYAAAEKAKDADGVVAYYSDDAVSYSRNEEPVSGKAAIRERIARRLETDTTGNYSVYKIVDLFADGDMAVEIGSWSTIDPAGDKVETGHYMSHFEKRDGKYVCVRDMSVNSAPEKKTN